MLLVLFLWEHSSVFVGCSFSYFLDLSDKEDFCKFFSSLSAIIFRVFGASCFLLGDKTEDLFGLY